MSTHRVLNFHVKRGRLTVLMKTQAERERDSFYQQQRNSVNKDQMEKQRKTEAGQEVHRKGEKEKTKVERSLIIN